MLKIDADSLREWNECLAALATLDSRDEIPGLLANACKALFHADSCMLNVFGESMKPAGIYEDLPPNVHAHQVDGYLSGAYLLDPYYRAGVNGIPSGLYRLRDVAPPGFSKSEYYRRWYKNAKIIDEVGFITHFPDGCFANMSFVMFEGSQRFRKSAIERLALSQPVVDKLLTEYWAGKGATDSALHSQLEVALSMFGDSVLTSRESEVVRLYLQGHSTRSISDRLGISTHTVSMHRKNAYAKLDINSQTELFHLFIDSLTCFDPAAKADPLRRYLGVA